MHELSVACSIVEHALAAAQASRAGRIMRVRCRVGALCGVVSDALRFAWDMACADTACAGALLEIEEVPLTIRCARDGRAWPLADALTFCCPDCGGPPSELLSGRELELVSIECESGAAESRTGDTPSA